jgi:hypothetical protein
MKISKAMGFALSVAAHRSRGTLCPVRTGKGRINAAAETALLDALQRRGLIDYDGPIPRINAAGVRIVDAQFANLARPLS